MKLHSLRTIQALRAFAALSVVLAHIPFIAVGTFGVDVFFVISGFIVCYITQEDTDHFFLKRAFRIVPLYWSATLAITLLASVKPSLLQSTTATPMELLQSLFFLPYTRASGLVQPILFLGWTLNFEVFFYFVFGACLALTGKRAPLVCAAVLILFSAAGALFPLPIPLRFWFRPNLLEFVAGIFAFLMFRRGGGLLNTPRLLNMAILAAAAVAMILLATFRPEDHNVFVFGGLSLALFLAGLGLEGRIAIPGLLIALGDASYSLYLLHPYLVRSIQHIFDPMEHLSPHAIVAAAITVTAAAMAAWASFRLLERPSNLLLRRLLPRDAHPEPVVDQRP